MIFIFRLIFISLDMLLYRSIDDTVENDNIIRRGIQRGITKYGGKIKRDAPIPH